MNSKNQYQAKQIQQTQNEEIIVKGSTAFIKSLNLNGIKFDKNLKNRIDSIKNRCLAEFGDVSIEIDL